MRAKTNYFKVNGTAMLAPDEPMEVSYQDLDASDAGRDESGYMHRIVVRNKVGSWNFAYSYLTKEEYAYLLSVLPGAGSFTFTYPTPAGSRQTKAYLSAYSVVWQDVRTGLYRNMKFSIIEC